MIYNNLLQIYLLMVFSIIMHEISHFFVAVWLGLTNIKLNIGDEFFSVKIGKLRISPLIFSGNVEVDEESLLSKNKRGIVAFFVSGNIANIVIIIVGLVCVKISTYFEIIIQINIIMVVINSIPVFGSDVKKICYYLKMKQDDCLNNMN